MGLSMVILIGFIMVNVFVDKIGIVFGINNMIRIFGIVFGVVLFLIIFILNMII